MIDPKVGDVYDVDPHLWDGKICSRVVTYIRETSVGYYMPQYQVTSEVHITRFHHYIEGRLWWLKDMDFPEGI